MVPLIEASDGVLGASGTSSAAVCLMWCSWRVSTILIAPGSLSSNILTLWKSKVSEFKPCLGPSFSVWFLTNWELLTPILHQSETVFAVAPYEVPISFLVRVDLDLQPCRSSTGSSKGPSVFLEDVSKAFISHTLSLFLVSDQRLTLPWVTDVKWIRTLSTCDFWL